MSTYDDLLKEKKNSLIEEEKVIDEDQLKHLETAAGKMVDQIEKRRKAGKYDADERTRLVKVFLDNMMAMVRGEITRSGKVSEEMEEVIIEKGIPVNLLKADKGKEIITIEINGKPYDYKASGVSFEELLRKFKKMLGFSEGKALVWLKKNAEHVGGGKLPNIK